MSNSWQTLILSELTLPLFERCAFLIPVAATTSATITIIVT